MNEDMRMTLRLPPNVGGWLKTKAREEFCSVNHLIVRALRERMAATGDSFAGTAPAAALNETALAGGPINQR